MELFAVQTSIAVNPRVVSYVPQAQKLQDFPYIMHQLGQGADATIAQDDDDMMPDLVPGETFETASVEETKA
ncbi:nascent polypeptide-associated complex beta subunit [Trifolium repens]|nr:nascent polypeptide-associated complex beta subunit [Trifolium repens]